MTEFGQGRFVHITGSTHKESGIRDVESQEVHERLIKRLCGKIRDNRDRITRFEEHYLEDAEIAVISYGATSRPAAGAVYRARNEGKKVGLLRLVTIWPFPGNRVRELGKNVKKILVPEMNLGQLSREVERFVKIEVLAIPKIGGIVHTIDEIYSTILKEI